MTTLDDTAQTSCEHTFVQGDNLARDRTSKHLPWLSAIETGINALDLCHRQLIAECNDLLTVRSSAVPLETIVARASALVENCISHFDIEEDLMRRTRFPRVEQHIAEHLRLRRELPRLVSNLAQSGDEVDRIEHALDALRFALIELLVRHDTDYRSHLLDSQGH